MTDQTPKRTLYEERPNLLISLQAGFQRAIKREAGETPQQYRARRLRWASDQLGFEVETFNDLTREQAHALLDALPSSEPAEDAETVRAMGIRDKATLVMTDYVEGVVDRPLAKRALGDLGFTDSECDRLLKIAEDSRE